MLLPVRGINGHKQILPVKRADFAQYPDEFRDVGFCDHARLIC